MYRENTLTYESNFIWLAVHWALISREDLPTNDHSDNSILNFFFFKDFIYIFPSFFSLQRKQNPIKLHNINDKMKTKKTKITYDSTHLNKTWKWEAQLSLSLSYLIDIKWIN